MAGHPETAKAVIDPDRILNLVNLARGTYGAFELPRLLPGQTLSASFCPLGRSLRKGVEDWLFVAVGTKHLRIWTLGKDPAAVGRGILAAWEMPQHRPKKSAEGAGFIVLPLRPELTDFVNQFDRGLWPGYHGEVDHAEVDQLRQLAQGIPLPLLVRSKQAAKGGGSGTLSRLPEINLGETLAER